MATGASGLASHSLVSLGPDCGVKHRIEELVHHGAHIQSQLFDWLLSDLTAVAAALGSDDPDDFFAAQHWQLVGTTPTHYYEFEHTQTGLHSLHDARRSEFETVDLALAFVSERATRRLHRLRLLLRDASKSLRFLHVVLTVATP